MAESGTGAFRAFEHDGWQNIPAEYHDGFGRLTMQTADFLLDAAQVGAGTELLDVATGPGYVAAAAARRGARVTGLDFSANMVAQARRLHPGITFQEGDAESLPFPAEDFDAVTMNFGLLHLERPEQALAEARRVLRGGGRLAFTVWAKPEPGTGFDIVLRAIEAHGQPDAPIPSGPPFFRFNDSEECVRALLAAGFVEPRVTRIPLVWNLPSPDSLFDQMIGSTVRTAGLLRAQAAEAQAAIRTAMRDAARARQKEDGVHLPMPAVLTSAVKR